MKSARKILIIISMMLLVLTSTSNIYASSLNSKIKKALKTNSKTNVSSWNWNFKESRELYQDVRNAYPICYIREYGKYYDLKHSRYSPNNNGTKHLCVLSQENIKKQKKMTKKTQKVLKLVVYKTGSRVAKIKKLNKYVKKHIRPAKGSEIYGTHVTTAYSAISGVGVCQGYAATFKYLCDINKIPCKYIVGHKKNNNNVIHAWNVVKINKTWYVVDVTFNDTGNDNMLLVSDKTHGFVADYTNIECPKDY